MKNLSSDNQADDIKAFNLTFRYLDDLLNIDNPYFEGMVNQIYPPELQLNKANTSDTEVPSKIYDKRDDITQTCPCNILQYFTVVKMFIFR